MITDSASATKIAPTITSKNSCFISNATVPSVAPRVSEPVSPMNTCAGCELYHKNPNPAPTNAAQKIVATSPLTGRWKMFRYSAICPWLVMYPSTPNVPATNSVQPIAKPSMPSVKLTAFDVPTITSVAKGINRIPNVGRTALKNGRLSAVRVVTSSPAVGPQP